MELWRTCPYFGLVLVSFVSYVLSQGYNYDRPNAPFGGHSGASGPSTQFPSTVSRPVSSSTSAFGSPSPANGFPSNAQSPQSASFGGTFSNQPTASNGGYPSNRPASNAFGSTQGLGYQPAQQSGGGSNDYPSGGSAGFPNIQGVSAPSGFAAPSANNGFGSSGSDDASGSFAPRPGSDIAAGAGFTSGGFNGQSPSGAFGSNFGGGAQSSDFQNNRIDDDEENGDFSAIPGEPGQDYPILSEIPQTSFSCSQQQYPGYYADVEARCQVFHICANNLTYDFLCPNGTIFHQQHLVCVWWNQFDCESAPSLFGVNANIYEESQNAASAANSGFSDGTANGGFGTAGGTGQLSPNGQQSGGQSGDSYSGGPASNFGGAPASGGFGAPSSSYAPSASGYSGLSPSSSLSNGGFGQAVTPSSSGFQAPGTSAAGPSSPAGYPSGRPSPNLPSANGQFQTPDRGYLPPLNNRK